jgi:CheY-specific phosphatase CheX
LSAIQFFGEFLIERWIITREQLLEALELQEYRNQKFGSLAVRKGYLTEEEVAVINDYQRKEDMRFGDVAVMLGLLTPDQAQEIITYQKNNYLYLGEALIELGHVTEDVMDRELSIFREEQAPYGVDDLMASGEVVGEELVPVCLELTSKMFARMIGIGLKIGEGILNTTSRQDTGVYHLSVSMPITGKIPIHFVLSVSDELATMIATYMLGEDVKNEPLEVIEDSVKEFHNVVCGNVVAKLAKRGATFTLGLPEVLGALPIASDGFSVLVFPINVSQGAMDIRFLIPNE